MDTKEKVAIGLLKNEISNWENEEAQIDGKTTFMMQNVLRKARRNYFGIWNNPVDKVTGRQKLWIPMTEWICESIVKNIDIDTSDIRVKAKNQGSNGIAGIFRYVIKYYLEKMKFGKLINDIIRMTAIDGTAFLKTWKEDKEIKARIIDGLNMIVDPTANSDSETPFIERHLMEQPEFMRMAKKFKWTNLDNVETTRTIDRTGFMQEGGNSLSEVPMVELYERWGYAPKSAVTGNDNDTEYVYTQIIASDVKGSAQLHFVKQVKQEDNPYTSFKYKDLWNRFHGRGVAEMLFGVQAYTNETVNTRMNTARIAQSGLFKIRGGVTPQQFSKMFQTSAIKLKGRDDIERFDTGTVDPSSYRDEEVAKKWGLDVTGAFDQGEVTASTPATNALIQERGSQAGFNLVQENIALSLEAWIKDKVVPRINKLMKVGDTIRITGNPADLSTIQEKLVKNNVYTSAQGIIDNGGFITDEDMEQEIAKQTLELDEQGTDRFLEIDEPLFDTDFDIEVVIKDEKINPALIAQSITQAMGIVSQFPGAQLNTNEAVREIFDSLGLDGNRFLQKETLGEAQAQQAGQVAQQEQMGGVGTGVNEATLNPTPNSRPVT